LDWVQKLCAYFGEKGLHIFCAHGPLWTLCIETQEAETTIGKVADSFFDAAKKTWSD